MSPAMSEATSPAMPPWSDLFLAMPLPEGWQHGLLFVTFGLHLLFVLLMLGTALLGLLFFLRQWLKQGLRNEGEKEPLLWSKRLLHSHLGLKSLAVVLGVAPLLLIQVRSSHAFFTVTGLFAYAWLAVIPLLIVAFLLIDGMDHQIGKRGWLAFVCGVAGVGALLTVPAIFTGVLSLMERQELWAAFAAKGFALPLDYAANWILRYLHIVGAALVFGAAFHLFFSARQEPDKAQTLRKWIFAAILAQILTGLPLLLTPGSGLPPLALMAVALGTAAALTTLWAARQAILAQAGALARLSALLPLLLPFILVSMLTTRQILQDHSLLPGKILAEKARLERSKVLASYSGQALDAFKLKLATVYNNGNTIYNGACQPCHGGMGEGDGPAAARLLIPAADLSAIRADRDAVYAMLLHGTPGSAMPYFRLYDRNKLESLLDTLSERFDMFAPTPDAGVPITAAARQTWSQVCATCHGSGGEVSKFGQGLLPAPPDLRVYSLTHEHALAVISEGYPGTAMQPFRSLPEALRQGLAGIANSFRLADRG